MLRFGAPRQTLASDVKVVFEKFAAAADLLTPPTLRDMTADDLPHLLGIEAESFPDDPYTENTFRRLMSVGKGRVAESGGKPVGYLLHRDDEDTPGLRYVQSIAVHPNYRRAGVGEAAMRDFVSAYPAASADVDTTNKASKGLFKKLGFKTIRTFREGQRRAHRMHRADSSDSKSAFDTYEPVLVLVKRAESMTCYECPKCGGDLYGGDPKTGTRFRGGGECVDCGHQLSLIGHTRAGTIKKKASDEDSRPFTICVDLDGTLAEKEEPFDRESIGPPIERAVSWVRRFHEKGARIIIFTVRGDRELVGDWLEEHKVPFDYINENPDQPPESSGKIYADLYWDDRAFNAEDPDENGPEILRRLLAHGDGEEDKDDGPSITIVRQTVVTITGPDLLEALGGHDDDESNGGDED